MFLMCLHTKQRFIKRYSIYKQQYKWYEKALGYLKAIVESIPPN